MAYVIRQPRYWLSLLSILLLILPLLALTGVPQAMSTPNPDRPTDPVYLWAEKPLVNPDREHIKDQRVYAVDNPALIPYWPAQPNGAAVVIFPGGGYVRLAINHEGHDIAKWFAARGVAAFVVKYRMKEYGFPANLEDGLRALRLVRSKAASWGLDGSKIGVIGFSAGGHMAAGVATRYDYPPTQNDPLAAISARPDFAILGYPVITLEGTAAHAGSRTALLGENPNPQLVRDNSLQHQVKADVPPVFMFHGIGDQSVPVTNSLVFFDQVQKYNKRSELHIYQTGIHGVGMIQGQGTVSDWPRILELWLVSLGVLPPAIKGVSP